MVFSQHVADCSGLHHDSATHTVVLVCDKTSTISHNYVRQGYSEILVSFSNFFKSILKFLFFVFQAYSEILVFS